MSRLKEILDELRGESAITEDDYQTAVRELNEVQNAMIWRPIEEIAGNQARYADEAGLLLLAPELVDGDCNVHGVGMGYYQDDRDVPCGPDGAIRFVDEITGTEIDYGGWLACKWNMTTDEWMHVPCTPTHYIRLRGVST